MYIIELKFQRAGLINSTNHPDFVSDMYPTVLYRKDNDVNVMLLKTEFNNETPEGCFHRCLTIIHKHIKSHLTGDEALTATVNFDKNTLKEGTVVLNTGEVLIKTIFLFPDFTV